MPEAVAVAAPVAARVATGREGVAVGASGTGAHVDLDGFIVSVFGGSSPLLPNGIAIGRRPAWSRVGERVHVGPGSWGITWRPDAVPVRETRLVSEASVERGGALLTVHHAAPNAASFAGAGLETARTPRGRAGIGRLLAAVEQRDATVAAEAADLLLGLGPGLTPEGDDLLAASAAVLAAASHADVAAALVPGDVRARTSALSATLLELAAEGHAPEALRAAFDPAASETDWRTAADRLDRLGASTGRAYALAAGASAFLLGQ